MASLQCGSANVFSNWTVLRMLCCMSGRCIDPAIEEMTLRKMERYSDDAAMGLRQTMV